jgi:short subunit dehydrogenase-like uncharacterized protein
MEDRGSRKREFDLVVWGATGFTGKLVVAYLAKSAPTELTWAIAGRDQSKLENIIKDVGGSKKGIKFIVADVKDQKSMDELAKKTKVIISTAGPFSLLGTPVVEACIRNGTDYCDITGESPWVRKIIDTYHEEAQQKGVILVPFCGFDSIPSDLTAYVLAHYAHEKLGAQLDKTKAFVRLKGGFSGGTFASMVTMMENPKSLSAAGHPYYLDPSPDYRNNKPKPGDGDQYFLGYDKSVKQWTVPFIMARLNTRVVRRSHSLLAQASSSSSSPKEENKEEADDTTLDLYGPSFRYQEVQAVNSFLRGLIFIIGFYLIFLVLAVPFLRRKVVVPLLPQPGQGPSPQRRSKSWFSYETYATVVGGKRLKATMKGGDPGYDETAKMLAEAGICLALHRDELPAHQVGGGGVLTPATAFGMVLADRLQKAGLGIKVTQL